MSSNYYNYEFINEYNSTFSPSTVHVKNTGLARFFKRYLLQEAFSVFDWTMPETWAKNYFLYVLYVIGYIGILDTDKFGVIPQHGGLGGYTVMYQPQYMLINNPLFKAASRKLVIDEDCVCLRLQPDYMGLYDLVDYYGDLMALCGEATGVNLLNSKMPYIFAAENKATAESYKKLYDTIASGEPAAFVDKNLFDEEGNLRVAVFNQDVGANFVVTDLLDAMRTIRCQFLTAIGIPNANTDKRERLNTDEVNANNFETRALCAVWLDELKKGCKKARDMFGIDLDVDWRSDLKGGSYARDLRTADSDL